MAAIMPVVTLGLCLEESALRFFAHVPSDDSSGVDYDPFRIFPPVFLDCKFFSEWTVLIIVLK